MYFNIHIFILILSIIDPRECLHAPSAICFLTRHPLAETIEFGLELANKVSSSVDVFILVDDNQYTNIPKNLSTIQFIQIDESEAVKHGFHLSGTVGISKQCSAWDKGLYYFSKRSIDYEFVWFVEADSFIPSIQAFIAVHELYSSSYDLITPRISYNTHGGLNWHWPKAVGKFILPWANSMVCSVGCSRRILTAVKEYAQWRGYLAFIEFCFHTLALQDHQMKVVQPYELETIVWRFDYLYEHLQAKPFNWLHPIKDFKQQKTWRYMLANTSSTVSISSFYKKLDSVEEQLRKPNIRSSFNHTEQQLRNLSVEFELVKGYIPAFERRQLRNRFVRLARNKSQNFINIFHKLADHAFRLPENFVFTIQTPNKTIHHLNLEKALEDNKQTVLHLMRHDHPTKDEQVTISWLREEAVRLILELTAEIQCEQKPTECKRKSEWFEINYDIKRYNQNGTTVVKQLFSLTIVLFLVLIILYKSKKKY